MHAFTQTLRAGLAIAAVAALAACGGDGHDHSEDGHSHEDGHVHVAPNGGLLVELGDHAANAEFLIDHETGTMTMYTYDAHADNAARSTMNEVVISIDTHADEETEVVLAAQASKLSKETVGDSSTFVGQHDLLKEATHFHGTIKAVSLLGQEFTDVKFDYDAESEGEGHDDHDHDHEGDGEGSEG